MYFQVCSNSTYPQHSGERYRTNSPLVLFVFSEMEDILVFPEPAEGSFMVLDTDLDDANGHSKVQMILAMHQNIIHFFWSSWTVTIFR